MRWFVGEYLYVAILVFMTCHQGSEYLLTAARIFMRFSRKPIPSGMSSTGSQIRMTKGESGFDTQKMTDELRQGARISSNMIPS